MISYLENLLNFSSKEKNVVVLLGKKYDFNESKEEKIEIENVNESIIQTSSRESSYLLSNNSDLGFQIITKKSKKNFTGFLYDFESIIYFSYRKNFSPILPSSEIENFTSDAGWGCLHRTGQMLIARALIIFNFEKEFRLPKQFLNTYKEIKLVKKNLNNNKIENKDIKLEKININNIGEKEKDKSILYKVDST
eukprot:EC824965.1.p1 GENE.EC824965.1~~EC824965.1.p1  ORF type:complete len:194 (+),score=90.46 EC824965.1:55-636(+)